MRDDDEGKPTQDSDRAAILARRKQFIALALSGLTTTVACTDGTGSDSKGTPTQKADKKDDPVNQPPQPCLGVEQHPQVCLSVAIDPPPENNPPPETNPPVPETDPQVPSDRPQIPPNVCLKFAQPPMEDPYETKPKPQPCLKKAPPQPG